MSLQSSLNSLMRGESLRASTIEPLFDELLHPHTEPIQLAALMALLRAKGETVEELSAMVLALRKRMRVIPIAAPVLDLVGTGGDKSHSINISTASAMLAASCGVKVAKHGNRSVSSMTGSADVLEALGIKIDLSPIAIKRCIEEVGIGFCYAPLFQPLSQPLREVRKNLKVPTTFNLLGPLLNPALVSHAIIGVYDETMLPILAEVLVQTGTEHAMLVHGGGLDEISTIGPVRLVQINRHKTVESTLNPVEYGFPPCSLDDLRGGDRATNAAKLLEVFKGKKGPIADTLILNAAVALYLFGRHALISEGIAHARETLYSKGVLTLLNHWIECSHDS